MENPKPPFVEEINFDEIEILEVVGKGSFGVVKKGKWRDQFVAVKMIMTESEKKAFFVERHQLSRVNHPNIVKLYGTCMKSHVCLVMEYAEGGSLYNVLHCSPQSVYTAAHAVSWTHQCAMGVAYLHNMKPKALIHRDLKPPNLLLIKEGTVLKICDFGTACDIQTNMTNNKGSAAWMAPEVFEGFKYSEKCDVFSWGIILWEVLTRRKPFDEIGRTAYQIMWAVHSGQRPPLIKDCPQPLEDLMISCWDKLPQSRPSMDEVVTVMEGLRKYFKGADKPIYYGNQDDNSGSDEYVIETSSKTSEEDQSNETGTNASSTVSSHSETQKLNEQSLTDVPEPVTSPSSKNEIFLTPLQSVSQDKTSLVKQASTELQIPCIIEMTPPVSGSPRASQTSAPASLANSQENLLNLQSIPGVKEANLKRLSGEISPLAVSSLKPEVEPQYQIHRRAGSYGSLIMGSNNTETMSSGVMKDKSPSPLQKTEWSSSLHQSPPQTYKSNYQSVIHGPHMPHIEQPHKQSYGPPQESIEDLLRLMLKPEYQPLQPYLQSKESMQLYENYKKMAHEYIQVQQELAVMLQRKADLADQLSKLNNTSSPQFHPADASKYYEEYLQLQDEKKGLQELHRNLKRQLEILKQAPSRKNTGDSWELLP